MAELSNHSRYKSNLKLLFVAAGIVFGFWFAYEITGIAFLFFFAVVLTLVLNAPTMWLIKQKVPRTLAALIVFFTMITFLGLIGWLVVPKILEQISTLFSTLPDLSDDLKSEISNLLKDYPQLQEKLLSSSSLEDDLPSTMNVVANIGTLSFSIIGMVFLFVIFFSIVIYMLISPEPLLETYLTFFAEERREKAAYALARASRMMVGWMYSNLLVGTMEAILVFFFLTYMEVPGVWIWVGLALFGEMVPKIGPYIMAIPPMLIALSIDPLTALWVGVFYLVMNELMGDLVMPRIRASTMDLHPVSTLFVMLAMASAFGLVGALIATPLTAFVKAYYEAFFRAKVISRDTKKEIDIILRREV